MHDFSYAQYLPLSPQAFTALAALLFVAVMLVQIRLLRYTYTRLGVSSVGGLPTAFSLAGRLLRQYSDRNARS